MEFLRKDAYVVAVAPAVVFLGVYAHELGRYYYLRIPASFIDLSINRVLAGGVLIGALAAILIGLAVWAWRLGGRAGELGSFLAAIVVATIYFTLPLALWMSRAPQGGEWSELLAIVTGIGSVGIKLAQKVTWHWVTRSDSGEALHSGLFKSAPSKGLLVGLLLLWTLVVFAGLGFAVERHKTSRQCVADSFIADVRGDVLILKKIVGPKHEVSSSTRFVPVEGADLVDCAMEMVGAPGLTNLLIRPPEEKRGGDRWLRDQLMRLLESLGIHRRASVPE